MSLQDRIKVKVESEVKPQHFDLINESHLHSGPATESHFKLIVVSETFNGLSAVKRHQRLYAVLAEELREGVHALALHLYTPEEWASRQSSAPDSPDCRGGSKHA
jgi:stress-induced morphogen